MNKFAQHLFLFKLALVFLTRLPIKIKQDVQDQDINAASGYFPLVGVIIAVLCAAVLLLTSLVLPNSLAVLMCMVASVLITGVFHEDGLADTADGFGGGWTPQQKLTIMKDSRLGTYGTTALVFAFLIKFQALLVLSEVSLSFTCLVLIFAHVISRALALSVIPASEYVEAEADNTQSKTKPVAQSLSASSIKLVTVTIVLISVLLLTFSTVQWLELSLLLIGLWLIRTGLIRFYQQQIGGYNGDVLGATQQVIELSCYVGFIVILSLNNALPLGINL